MNLASLILATFGNEMLIEKELKLRFSVSCKFPDFKVLKFSGFYQKHGLLYIFVVYGFCFVKPFIDCFRFIVTPRFENRSVDRSVALITSSLSALAREFISKKFNEDLFYVDRRNLNFFLATRYNFASKITFVLRFLCIYFYVLFQSIFRKFSVFSVVDLFELLAVADIIAICNERGLRFGTDDHFQRFAFITSRFSKKSFIFQHGFVEPPSTLQGFGSIEVVFCYNHSFLAEFSKYIPVIDHVVFISGCHEVNDLHLPSKKPVLLLASSAPFIEYEINFLKHNASRLKNFFVVLKVHPLHAYCSRLSELKSLVDSSLDGGMMPLCQLVVSYNSFLNFQYESIGVKSLTLKHCKKGSDFRNLLESLSENDL
jgi:hypothetical protein